MNALFISLGIALIHVVFTLVSKVPQPLNFKPFNCTSCFGLWVGIIVASTNIYFDINYLMPLAIGGYVSYGATILRKFVYKIS